MSLSESRILEDCSVSSDDSLTAVLDEVPNFDKSFDDALQKIDRKYGSETTWNEEVQSEIESLGLSLHDSLVMALRDEATKMDAVIAADYANSLQEEVQRLSRELAERTDTVDQLRTALQEKEERIGTLELERDLYKADTSKLTRDLKKCVQKLKAADHSSSRREATTRTTAASSTVQRSQPVESSSSNESWGSTTNSSITTTTVSRSEASNREPPSFPVVEKPKLVARNRKMTRSQFNYSRGRGFQFCRGFPSRRSSSKVEENDQEVESRDLILQEQIQEMGRRMNTALETSDELRRRLAMVSRYYEGALGKMEYDMASHMSESETEKRVIVETLRSQMHEQELIIRDLRSRVLQPFK